MLSAATALDWAVFSATVVSALVLDRLLFGRTAHHMSFREATVRSVFWVLVGVGYTGFVHQSLGTAHALTYFTAYLIEKSLSVDNLFVFLVIFSYFKITDQQQQRVLFWGIAGAIITRAIFIIAGTAMLQRFHWMMYVFGAFLIFTGVKLAFKKDDDEVDPEDSFVLRVAKRHLRTTTDFEGNRFFTRRNGLLHATPLFLVLLVVEFTDVVFAVDSVPAVLAVSNDVYVIYTSNIFAILGLRALYFVLAGMMSRFHYLDLGLAFILVFIGVKMVVAEWYKIGNWASLGVIAGVLTVAIVASLLRPVPKAIAGEKSVE